jgi:hypothetical protein
LRLVKAETEAQIYEKIADWKNKYNSVVNFDGFVAVAMLKLLRAD